jgi:hypothetical protein
MKIVKGNVIKTVSEKAGKIACNLMGWSEFTEAHRPPEIGTKTRKIEPPVITKEIAAERPIKLKEPEVSNVIDQDKVKQETGAKQPEPVKTEKKTRKSPVKSKSSKK